jgi:hypothetical protein
MVTCSVHRIVNSNISGAYRTMNSSHFGAHRTMNSNICGAHMIVNSNLSGVHRTVNSNLSGGPTASPFREGNDKSDLGRFPNFVPTAMGGLGAIKGPPRRPYSSAQVSRVQQQIVDIL